MDKPDIVPETSKKQMHKRDALQHLALGLAQIMLATLTIIAWLQNAPTSLVTLLLLITGLLMLCSIRQRSRSG